MPRLTSEQIRSEATLAWTELTTTLARIPDERWMEKVGKGTWRVLDIVAHLAYWSERLPADLRACLDDTAVHELGSEVNKRVARERKSWTVSHARDALTAAELAALDAIEHLPDEHPRLTFARKLAYHEAVEHIRAHCRQLQTWLDAQPEEKAR